MKKLRCLITDDEPLARKLIKGYVERMPELELLGEAGSGIEAIEILSKEQVDLIFLDIQMPELSGMNLAKTLDKQTKVIFTTAFEQYAVEGYKVNASGYLLKPISFEEFEEAVRKVIAQIEAGAETQVAVSSEYIMIKADYKIWQLKLEDIKYIEGVKDYVKIYREGEVKALMPLMSMKSLEEILPAEKFMRVHRSYIINLDKITTIERNQVIFGEERISISDKYKEQFQAFLDKRFGGK